MKSISVLLAVFVVAVCEAKWTLPAKSVAATSKHSCITKELQENVEDAHAWRPVDPYGFLAWHNLSETSVGIMGDVSPGVGVDGTSIPPTIGSRVSGAGVAFRAMLSTLTAINIFIGLHRLGLKEFMLPTGILMGLLLINRFLARLERAVLYHLMERSLRNEQQMQSMVRSCEALTRLLPQEIQKVDTVTEKFETARNHWSNVVDLGCVVLIGLGWLAGLGWLVSKVPFLANTKGEEGHWKGKKALEKEHESNIRGWLRY